jgi:hypothetical protein
VSQLLPALELSLGLDERRRTVFVGVEKPRAELVSFRAAGLQIIDVIGGGMRAITTASSPFYARSRFGEERSR